MSFLFIPRLLRSNTKSICRPFISRAIRPYLQTQTLRLVSTTTNKMESNNPDLQLSNLFDVKGKVALVTGGGWRDCLSIIRDHINMLQVLELG